MPPVLGSYLPMVGFYGFGTAYGVHRLTLGYRHYPGVGAGYWR